MLRDEYPLYFEKEAARDVDVQAHRHWKVLAQSKNELGGRRAYRVTVGPQDLLLADRHPLFSRAAFVQHALWVTTFNENELYATGAYPNQQVITNGVNTYQYNNDRIKDSDVVVWVTQSTSYLPRIEDHPSGRMQHVSVRIEPDGFFDSNPTIDLPPQR